MRRFKNIVVLYECDRATLDRAASLAKENRARLTVVQVVGNPPDNWEHVDLGGKTLDLRKLVVNELEKSLKEFVASAKHERSRIATKVLTGIPSVEIVRDVIKDNRDLLIMTAEGKGGLKERLFGSTARHLLRQCPCPVWIMKPTRRKRFRQIMAAVDPAPENKVRDSMNATILQLASSLAAQDHADLQVVHAWTLYGETLMRRPGVGLAESEIRRYAQQEAQKQRRALEALLAKHIGGMGEVNLVNGNAGSVIPQMAATMKVDLLVMGTVCRTGIPGFFIGNTAETILDKVDCSVLTVKPEGFQSAVQLA
jgi:nucleotide-binding universal stress UspA family protein